MSQPCSDEGTFMQDSLRLEGITVSVGFDDFLDYTLSHNHGHFDNYIVVTSHTDRKTAAVADKHGCMCVPTDLLAKNGRRFNKGAAINAGLGWFQWWGWRLHLDADILLPDKFRQTLFNHTHLEQHCLYGADRIDVIGEHVERVPKLAKNHPQHRLALGVVDPTHGRTLPHNLGGRIVSHLDGYSPIGFFQLWHASQHKDYPYSLGTAAHDDVLFARLWPLAHRRLLPSVVCYHLCTHMPVIKENWDGNRRMPRLDGWGAK